MASTDTHAGEDHFPMPVGTVLLIKKGVKQEIILHPKPSSDPNDPLNWTKLRKFANFALTMAVSVVVFTQLSVGYLYWQWMIPELGVDYAQLNNATAIGYLGTSLGCILFIPLAIKYGRRPVYLFTTAVMVATAFWSAKMKSGTELYLTLFIGGLAGSPNEAIVQMTVADLFFVHQHGSMNGLYLFMVMIGSFLVPVASGQQADTQGWRWCYMSMGISTVVIFIFFVFFYEETKYSTLPIAAQIISPPRPESDSKDDKSDIANSTKEPQIGSELEPVTTTSQHQLADIPLRSWTQRLSLISKTDESLFELYWRPMQILFTFPAITFTAIQYGFCLCWLSAISSITSIAFPYPPYNFSATAIGLTALAPFIGAFLGLLYGGVGADYCILIFSRRNNGYYEPEMRLYTLALPVLTLGGGMVMTGITTAKLLHWIWPVLGTGIYGFGFGAISDQALTLTLDSYPLLVGEAFIGIAFIRNAISIIILFALAPWIEAQGLRDVSIVFCFCAIAVGALFIPMIMFGKKWRTQTQAKYEMLVAKKGNAGR